MKKSPRNLARLMRSASAIVIFAALSFEAGAQTPSGPPSSEGAARPAPAAFVPSTVLPRPAQPYKGVLGETPDEFRVLSRV